MTTESKQEEWPPKDCPPLAWPNLTDQAARDDWYSAVIKTYKALWENHATEATLNPVDEAKLTQLETNLGCKLPPALRHYHATFGVTELAETLCGVDDEYSPIQPLLEAYPGITDIAEDSEIDMDLAEQLIAFDDYLGNGNMFCFHATTQKIYYFDHDSEPHLTPFCNEITDYLDALMIKNLAEIMDDDEAGEKLLVQKFGKPLVKKWMY